MSEVKKGIICSAELGRLSVEWKLARPKIMDKAFIHLIMIYDKDKKKTIVGIFLFGCQCRKAQNS